MDKQTKSKFDRTTLFFSCDSMPGTIINQQIHTYLHVPVLLLSQVPHRLEHDTLSSHHYLTWKQIASMYICIGKNVSGIKKCRVHIIDRVRPRQLEIGLASSPGYIAALIMVLLQAWTYQ